MDKTSGLGCAADFYGVFVDDVLVGLGVSGLVVYVPTEGLEERIDKLVADLGFAISAYVIIVAVSGETLYEGLHGFRWLCHGVIY